MKSFEQLAHDAQNQRNSHRRAGRNLTVHDLLDRLEGVRDRGNGQWLAKCPAHEDNRASLSIKETSDGTILIHCFALCSPDEVVGAIGLEIADLFPQKLEPRKGTKPRWNYKDLLLVIKHEAMVMEIAASRFETLTPDELERVILAGQRIRTALEVANVR